MKQLPVGKLIALRTPIENGALKGEQLPTRLKLFGWGENATKKGPVKVGAATVASLATNQAEYGFDRIALDYNHNSLPGHPNYKPDPREIAAYGVAEVIEGDGVYLNAIDWTPSGEKYARNYVDLSPTPLLDDDGEVIFLHSVALCEQGAVEGLSFFNLDHDDDRPMKINKLLATILGLAEDASEEQLLEAGKTFLEKVAADKAAAEKAKTEPEKKDPPAGDVQALTARLDGIERGQLLALAAQEGKVIPASVRDSLPLENLKALIAETPVTVPLEKRTPAGIKPLTVAETGMSASDKAVAAQLGLSESDWK